MIDDVKTGITNGNKRIDLTTVLNLDFRVVKTEITNDDKRRMGILNAINAAVFLHARRKLPFERTFA